MVVGKSSFAVVLYIEPFGSSDIFIKLSAAGKGSTFPDARRVACLMFGAGAEAFCRKSFAGTSEIPRTFSGMERVGLAS